MFDGPETSSLPLGCTLYFDDLNQGKACSSNDFFTLDIENSMTQRTRLRPAGNLDHFECFDRIAAEYACAMRAGNNPAAMAATACSGGPRLPVRSHAARREARTDLNLRLETFALEALQQRGRLGAVAEDTLSVVPDKLFAGEPLRDAAEQ